MTELLSPKAVRELLQKDFYGQAVHRLCRDYLTLWDELQNERSISDRLIKKSGRARSNDKIHGRGIARPWWRHAFLMTDWNERREMPYWLWFATILFAYLFGLAIGILGT